MLFKLEYFFPLLFMVIENKGEGGLDAGARRKILCPCLGSNPDRPAHSQTLHVAVPE
jgi:hypothetical protein